ncbi:MAG: T9SS type A sorting domain-containing protein [Bacteroidales bacterium]|nr:T9SS type A sorting domain-containing protein [Bacteroidales bacterium]
MIKRIILYLIIFNTSLGICTAQEVVTGLQSNYSIIKYRNSKQNKKAKSIADTLGLPLFDDFSGQEVFPDSKKWSDDFVFINNTYTDRQLTTGVATFDALSNSGQLYESASSSVFEADHLTSQPINLNYSASDNIWLSFFYQSGGLADFPEKNDSLTLQFFAPDESQWYSVWKATNYTTPAFRNVMIKIDQSRFLRKGFRFRFRNYASLNPDQSDLSMVGNCDQWNIDYVLLDKNRSKDDTVFTDVAFRLPIRSILKNHESMPWKQFKEIKLQEMGSSIPIHYRNNDSIKRNVTRNFKISDVYKNTSYSFSAGATNIDPFTNVDYNANLIYTFNTDNNDSALFRITCSLITDDFDPKENDTIIYYQVFNNYFAFDDGTSEAGYGINGQGSRNAMVACRFESFIQDTLRALRICFNDSYSNANKRSFDIVVWNDNNGIPGDIVYSKEDVMVEQGSSINGFYTYYFTQNVVVNDVFYVGWRQSSETFLNAGLDLNTSPGGRQFYWLNGLWSESQVHGSIMIRPILGSPLTTSINDTYYINRNRINIWPNPATDHINIDPGELKLSGSSHITVIDLNGRVMFKQLYREQIDISSLPEGLYIVITSMNGKPVSYNRIIKTR